MAPRIKTKRKRAGKQPVKAQPATRNFESLRLATVQEAADWSGLRYRALLRLVKDGVIDAVIVGPEQQHNMSDGKQRRRVCSKYLIRVKPFIAWVEGRSAQSAA